MFDFTIQTCTGILFVIPVVINPPSFNEAYHKRTCSKTLDMHVNVKSKCICIIGCVFKYLLISI